LDQWFAVCQYGFSSIVGVWAMDDTDLVPTRHRLNVDDYHRMAEAGILGEDDRVELIDGELIDMAPIGQGHAGVVNGLNHALFMAFGGQAIVSVQNPLRLDRLNEPQPDVVILRPRDDFYQHGARPGPADVLLLVEVADSSLRYDRTVKLPLYARAGIGEVWIVDLRRRVVDVYRTPAGGGYATIETHGPEDTVTLGLAPEIAVALRRVFA
jgi:Uma2 family endonuclease